jgi:hypothetical protein
MQLLFGHYRYAAIALVTLLTLGIVATVVLTTTSAGCGPANALNIKTSRCLEGGKVGAVSSPTATPAAKGGFVPTQPSAPPPPPPDNSGASANPPYDSGSSSYPPYNAGSSSQPPYYDPGSGSFPPIPNVGSGVVSSGVQLSCRLPVYAGGPGSGGFIVFPGGTFVADPRSAVTVPSPSPGHASPTPAPGYGGPYPQGWFGTTYDAGYSKWLPVPYTWVSPDGAHYAYPLGGDIYVQNVANGTQLDLAEGRGFYPVDVENDGVYVITPQQAGLWFVAFSGSVRQVATTGFWQAVGGGFAYGTPTSQVPQGATSTLERLDLKTGTSVPYFSINGGQPQVIGFDAQGFPVVQVSFQQGSGLYIVGTQNYYQIAGITYGGYSPPYPQGPPITDKHGLWFTVGNGIVLYANGAWYAMASIGGQLAGQCL